MLNPLLKKKGLDPQEKNYCPVSNLPYFSKLVEHATLMQFDKHCREHHLLPDFQSAYRKGYSTKTSLMKITNDIFWSMERKQVTAVIVLDMLAAFDTVDHDLLLDILCKRFGIAETALQWYQSYLRPQGMKVHINDSYSSISPLNYSVPQGSASDANLFTAYCASIKSVIPDSITINGFADDHSIRKSFNAGSQDQGSQSIILMVDTVANIASWMDNMHLKLNPDKTKFIMFGYRNQLDKCKTSYVTISGSTIPKSPSVKYLGVTLDENLNLKEHILTKCRTAMANFVRICNIQQYLTTDACSTLVLGLCISHLDYVNALYYGLPNKTISHLQIVQSMCAKLTLRKSKYDSTTDALSQLHWLPIKHRVNFKIATITHKCIYGTAPQYLNDLLIPAPNPRSLKSSNDKTKLIIPFTRCKTFTMRSFNIVAPMIWNQLPMSL